MTVSILEEAWDHKLDCQWLFLCNCCAYGKQRTRLHMQKQWYGFGVLEYGTIGNYHDFFLMKYQ